MHQFCVLGHTRTTGGAGARPTAISFALLECNTAGERDDPRKVGADRGRSEPPPRTAPAALVLDLVVLEVEVVDEQRGREHERLREREGA